MTGATGWKLRVRDGRCWKDAGTAWLSGNRLRLRVDLGILGSVRLIGFPVKDGFS